MSAALKIRISPEEYLRRERLAEFKSEYFNGEMFAMAGASPTHVRINSRLGGLLFRSLDGGPCQALNSDLKVKVSATGLYTYPDQIVLCEEMQIEDGDVLLNPKILFEVLSPSTERYDRGGKFAHYRTIASLQEYILVAQVKPSVEQYVRQPDDRWLLTAYQGIDAVLKLVSAPASIPLTELYQGIKFPALSIYDQPLDEA